MCGLVHVVYNPTLSILQQYSSCWSPVKKPFKNDARNIPLINFHNFSIGILNSPRTNSSFCKEEFSRKHFWISNTVPGLHYLQVWHDAEQWRIEPLSPSGNLRRIWMIRCFIATLYFETNCLTLFSTKKNPWGTSWVVVIFVRLKIHYSSYGFGSIVLNEKKNKRKESLEKKWKYEVAYKQND